VEKKRYAGKKVLKGRNGSHRSKGGLTRLLGNAKTPKKKPKKTPPQQNVSGGSKAGVTRG